MTKNADKVSTRREKSCPKGIFRERNREKPDPCSRTHMALNKQQTDAIMEKNAVNQIENGFEKRSATRENIAPPRKSQIADWKVVIGNSIRLF
jgi:hypothetical protein